jgi:DNA polymerase/3'-5' exonuclease PolX
MGEQAGYRIIPDGTVANKWFIYSPENNMYIVQEKKGGRLRCSCKGYKFRQDCRHVRMDLGYVKPKRFPRVTIGTVGKAMMDACSRAACGQGSGKKWEIVGSYRRGLLDSKDIDVLILCDLNHWNHGVLMKLTSNPNVKIEQIGDVQARGTYAGVPFDISRVDEEDDWVWYLLYRTGSKEHNIEMRKIAKLIGLKMNEHGLFHSDGSREPFWPDTEEQVFAKLGMAYKKPEER